MSLKLRKHCIQPARSARDQIIVLDHAEDFGAGKPDRPIRNTDLMEVVGVDHKIVWAIQMRHTFSWEPSSEPSSQTISSWLPNPLSPPTSCLMLEMRLNECTTKATSDRSR